MASNSAGGNGLPFFWHNEPQNEINDRAGKGGKDREDGVKNANEGGVPTEPSGQPTADPAEETIA